LRYPHPGGDGCGETAVSIGKGQDQKKRPLKPEGYSRPKAQGPAGARWARTGLSVDGPEKMGCWSRCARHSPRLRDRAAADRSAAGEASKSSV